MAKSSEDGVVISDKILIYHIVHYIRAFYILHLNSKRWFLFSISFMTYEISNFQILIGKSASDKKLPNNLMEEAWSYASNGTNEMDQNELKVWITSA